MPRVNACRAACGRRCGRAYFALENLTFDHTKRQPKQTPNAFERYRIDLSPLSPFKIELSPLRVGTEFFNVDNDLRAFFRFVPTVPTFF